jgi:hypothetical protein
MALTECLECNGKVSDQADTCPHCGAPTSSRPRSLDPKDNRSLRYSDQEVAVMLSKKKKTSHVLHLILCIPTIGFWIPIWILCGLNNAIENSRIDRKIAKGK